MDGILIIDKHPGVTSHDVVAQVRHLLGQRRVGHTGTLDPFATGVLVMLVGRATRLSQFLMKLDKEYEAVIRLGYATDTGDVTGQPISGPQNGGPWTSDEIENAMASLRGEIDQVPPMYSAKKQGGKKLYELARAGEVVERSPVRVHIAEFQATATPELPKDNSDGTYDLKVRVQCSSGTYIRTLAEDFGKLLNVGAHLAELRRTRVGDFGIDQARTLERLKVNIAEEAIGRAILAPDEALSRLPHIELSADDVSRVQHGLNLECSDSGWEPGERVRMRDANGNLIAVGVFDQLQMTLHPAVVFPQL